MKNIIAGLIWAHFEIVFSLTKNMTSALSFLWWKHQIITCTYLHNFIFSVNFTSLPWFLIFEHTCYWRFMLDVKVNRFKNRFINFCLFQLVLNFPSAETQQDTPVVVPWGWFCPPGLWKTFCRRPCGNFIYQSLH